ncbi:MAG: response regulator transcription factor [Phaeodactylibacter sp.]|nr:response regulator transcription factor [Phaeodactylibacter sp.]MCB9049914.1 response regulator transcription factor [Lewinellaceae bacterium]
MEYRCIIIEDQLPAQRILQRYVAEITGLELSGSFTDPLAALEFMSEHPVDLIFLDIHLPKLSGMDFLKILPYKPKVILTTAFSEYALEGYEFDVVDYLLKPISFERFLKAVSKIIYHPEAGAGPPEAHAGPTVPAPHPYAFVKSDKVILKIEFEDIFYIKADDVYTWVYTRDKNHFLSYSLKYWLGLLPETEFCQVHKSYIVNLRYIEKIEGNQVFTPKGVVPIGRSFREGFLEKIDMKG